MPASNPEVDESLVALKQYIGVYCRAYRKQHDYSVDYPVLMTFSFDTLPKSILVQSTEPPLPIGSYWYNHSEIFQCVSLLPDGGMTRTWKMLTDHKQLYVNSVIQLSPEKLTIEPDPLPQSNRPITAGCQMVERLYLYGDPVEDLEPVTFRLYRTVSSLLAATRQKLDDLSDGQFPLVYNQAVTLNYIPSDSLHAVNKQWVESITNLLQQRLSAIENSPDIDILTAHLNQLEVSFNQIMVYLYSIGDVNALAKLTGATFSGNVFVPIDPNHLYTDAQSVPYMEIKRLTSKGKVLIQGTDF